MKVEPSPGLLSDIAPHHAAKMPADGEAKARAAVLAGCRGVCLGKFLEQPSHLLLRHADPGVGYAYGDPVAALEPLRLRRHGDGPLFRELVGVAREVEQRLPKAGLVGVGGAEIGLAIDNDAIAVLCGHRLDGLGHVLDQRRQRKRLEMKLHAPCLDLRQVEDVIDQCEQVATRAKNAIERLDVLLQCLRILPQHLGDADDGIERGSQLMAHVGEELRFVLTRFGKLPALLLDLVEEPCILDRQDRLRAEGLQEIDRALGKFARLLAAHHQRADDPIGAEQWNGQQRAEAGADDQVENR
jgi:hypothetical protein